MTIVWVHLVLAPAPAGAGDDAVDRAYERLHKFGLLTETVARKPTPPPAASADTGTKSVADTGTKEVADAVPTTTEQKARTQTSFTSTTVIADPSLRVPPQSVSGADIASGDANPNADAIRLIHSYSVLERLGLLSAPPAATAQNKSIDKRKERQVDRVLVEKSERRLVLLKNGKPVKEYKVALGGKPKGPKRREGDMRTPEGVYTLDWRNPESKFYKSLHISYPNQSDLQKAEELGVDPGGMIMIHGEHPMMALRNIYRRVANDWTEGCIAMLNEHIDELWQLVEDGTPIEIRP